MMLPYSWFSITITNTCENDGTAAAGAGAPEERVGGTDGLAGGRVSVGVEAGAVGVAVGVASATRLRRRNSNSGSLRSDPTAAGATLAAVFAGLPPSTIIVGTAASTAAPKTMIAPR